LNNTKDEFTKIMEECLSDGTFPFRSCGFSSYGEHITWHYKGFLNAKRTYLILKKHPEFKDIFFRLSDVEQFLKEHSSVWPNGKRTMQIRCCDGSRPRVFLIENLEIENKEISSMTDTQLGNIYFGLAKEGIC
jgi:hypothetical protein